MATVLRIGYQRGNPIIASTSDELTAAIDRISTESAQQPYAPVVEITVADDPFSHPLVYAGLGRERGFVQINGFDAVRATLGNPDATGEVVYDYQSHETKVPARQEVPLSIVRAVLVAYLTHDGAIPDDFPELQAAD